MPKTKTKRDQPPDLPSDLEAVHRKMLAARKLPEQERIWLFNRLMATVLNKHGRLPEHLKKFINH